MPIRRSAIAALIALPALHLGARAQGGAPRRLTPAQSEGPFYPVAVPADSDADLLTHGSLKYRQGQSAWVEGTLTDPDGRALRDATIEIWQCDQQGHYRHPRDGNRHDESFQGFGRAAVDAEGRWRFRTIKPVPYSGRTPHIHAKVKLGVRELLTTQLYVEGEGGNARDFLWRSLSAEDRAAITVPYTRGVDGWVARYALVVAA